MRLLVDFLCRFGWGLSVALVLTPSSLVPAGFFRVNILVVLGLATFAALLCGQPLPAHTWLLPAAAAVTAWMASIVWFAERTRPGIVLCVITALLLAAGTTGGPTTMALVSLRWLAGLAGLPVLLWLSRKTLEIPNTQSATGILYVACLAAILGELTAQLLSVAA